MSSGNDELNRGVAIQRRQVADAVLMGFLDASLAADLTTAKNNGYKPGSVTKNIPALSIPVDGINR